MSEKWRLIHPPTHIHYFSKKNLEQLLARCNFKVLHVSYPLIYRSARQIFYFMFLLNKKPSKLLEKIHAAIPESFYIPLNTFDIMFMKAYGSMAEVKKGLTDYFAFYNQKRWHQSLDRKTPAMVYFNTNPKRQVAA
jgi:hypothetical protein